MMFSEFCFQVNSKVPPNASVQVPLSRAPPLLYFDQRVNIVFSFILDEVARMHFPLTGVEVSIEQNKFATWNQKIGCLFKIITKGVKNANFSINW